jgi:hypothetical protein
MCQKLELQSKINQSSFLDHLENKTDSEFNLLKFNSILFEYFNLPYPEKLFHLVFTRIYALLRATFSGLRKRS